MYMYVYRNMNILLSVKEYVYIYVYIMKWGREYNAFIYIDANKYECVCNFFKFKFAGIILVSLRISSYNIHILSVYIKRYAMVRLHTFLEIDIHIWWGKDRQGNTVLKCVHQWKKITRYH